MEGMPFRTVCTGCHGELGRGFVPFCPGCGAMSDVAYDLAAVELRDSADPYVRFRDLLPVHDPELLPEDARFTPTEYAGASHGLNIVKPSILRLRPSRWTAQPNTLAPACGLRCIVRSK